MANMVCVHSKSGAGKSTSLKGLLALPEGTVLVINVLNKPLPFKGSSKFSICSSDDPDEIMTWIGAAVKKGYKVIVLDDIGYTMVNMFMAKAMERGYDKFNLIGKKFFDIINYCRQLPDDVSVYFLMHSDTTEDGVTGIKTLGRMLSDKVSVEGMFTTVLYGYTDGKKHVFKTQNDGTVIAKSPMDLFETDEIPNDLGLVDHAIREYYDLPLLDEEASAK